MSLIDNAKRAKKAKTRPVSIPSLPYLDNDGAPIIDAETGSAKCRYWVRRLSVGEASDVFGEVSSVEVLPNGTQKMTISHAKLAPALMFRALAEEDGTRVFAESDRKLFDSLEIDLLGEAFIVAQEMNPMGQAAIKNS